ncbi:MAG: hypothetical protein OIF58_08995 [Cohaesibacter sp.]|nr:hypothetical protein [Cohaesibacter sp.]
MSDDERNRLSEQFNKPSSGKNQEQKEDHRVVAEKDSTRKSITPPKFAPGSGPRNAPMGSVAIATDEQVLDIELIPYDPTEHPINLGTEDLTLDWEEHGYRVMVKQEEQPHAQGINGGRISRLALVKEEDAEIVADVYFDYGEWINPPLTPLQRQMVDDIKIDLNATPDKDFTRVDDPENDHDHEI